MHIATKSWNSAVICALLKKGPPLNLQDRWGKLVLKEAATRYSEDILIMLLGKAAKVKIAITNIKTIWDSDVLCEATRRGIGRVIKLLLETGKVNINLKDGSGRTPLSLVAEKGYKTIVKLLLKTSKVDINLKDHSRYRRTPLSFAAEKGHKAVIKLLLKTSKVDVNLKDNNGSNGLGRTPLSLAAEKGHKVVIKLLLETGKVNVNLKDNKGLARPRRTPLS